MEIDIEGAVRKYGDMVLRLAYVNTKNMTEAEDIFQEVFLKLFRYQNSIDCEEHLKSWLIRVTINQCHDYTASPWHKLTRAFGESEEVRDVQAEKEYEEDGSESYVTKAVMHLPLKYRQVVHLFYYEEYSIKEISEMLRENEATIKTKLRRGRKMLEERLEGRIAR